MPARNASAPARYIPDLMPPFALKYSDRQKEAVIRARLDREPPLNAPAVVRAAAAGELEEGLEPFDIPLATVRHYAQTEARRRAGASLSHLGRLSSQDFAATVAPRLQTMYEKRLKRVEQHGTKVTDKDLQELAKTCREIASVNPTRKATTTGAGTSASTGAGASGNGSASQPDWIAQLAKQDRSKPKRKPAKPTQQAQANEQDTQHHTHPDV